MKNEEDKLIITIELERNVNGTVKRSVKTDGAGFHFYEIIGLLQMMSIELREQSLETAKELPKDKPTRMVFKSDQTTPEQ